MNLFPEDPTIIALRRMAPEALLDGISLSLWERKTRLQERLTRALIGVVVELVKACMPHFKPAGAKHAALARRSESNENDLEIKLNMTGQPLDGSDDEHSRPSNIRRI